MKKKVLILVLLALVAIAAFFVIKGRSNKNDIVIGGVISLTGDNALQGKLGQNGMLLAIDFINEEGGIGGQKVVFKSEDSKTMAKDAITAFTKLVNVDDVAAALSTGDVEFQALNSTVDKHKIVTMATICSGMLEDNRSPYYFRYCYNEKIADSVLLSYLAEKMDVDQMVLVYPNNAWGQEIDKYNSMFASKYNIDIVDKVTYDVNSMEQKAVALKIIDNKVPVVCARGFGSSFESVLRSLKETGFEGIVVGDITIALPGTVSNTKGAVEGAYYVSFDLNDDPSDLFTAKYKTRYAEKYGIEPSVWDAMSFDACMYLLKGMEKQHKDGIELKDAMYSIDSIQLLLGNNVFSNSNDVEFNMNVYRIEDGVSILVTTE